MSDDGFPDDLLARLIQRLARRGVLEPHVHAGYVVTGSDVLALGELVEVDGMSQQRLGERLGLEKSTVSRLAAGLEGRGWLVRERDPGNRRFYRLALTAEGREVARRVGDDLRGRHRRLFAAMTPEERAALTVGLAGLVRAMDAEARRSPSG